MNTTIFRGDCPARSYFIETAKATLSLKAVTRLAYLYDGKAWDGPQSKAVYDYLTTIDLPQDVVVRHDESLSSGVGEKYAALPLQHETISRLRRPLQGLMRREALDAYNGKCAISGCDSRVVLEACHIIPHADDGPADVSNTILLRADLHKLFDLGLLALDPVSKIWMFHEDVAESYPDLEDTRLCDVLIADKGELENRLKTHWDMSQLAKA